MRYFNFCEIKLMRLCIFKDCVQVCLVLFKYPKMHYIYYFSQYLLNINYQKNKNVFIVQ